MFGFIKFLQEQLARLKSNKRIWFTIILIVSIIGMTSTIYLITTMTSRVSEKIYVSMANSYKLKVKTYSAAKNQEFVKLVTMLENDLSMTKFMKQENIKSLAALEDSINKQLEDNMFKNMFVDLYTKNDLSSNARNTIGSILESKESIFGVEVMKDGVYFIYIKPLIENGNIYGVVQVRESIHVEKHMFTFLDNEFAFILNKKMLPQLSIKTREGRYTDITNVFAVEQTFYESAFVADLRKVTEEEFEKMMNEGFIIDEKFYKTYSVVTDLNGVEIGMIIVGDRIDKTGGFVKLADSMTKQVITVALGLIISIMLFMF